MTELKQLDRLQASLTAILVCSDHLSDADLLDITTEQSPSAFAITPALARALINGRAFAAGVLGRDRGAAGNAETCAESEARDILGSMVGWDETAYST